MAAIERVALRLQLKIAEIKAKGNMKNKEEMRKMRASAFVKLIASGRQFHLRNGSANTHTHVYVQTLYLICCMEYRMRSIDKVNLAAQLCSQFAKIWQVVHSTKSSLIIVGTSFHQALGTAMGMEVRSLARDSVVALQCSYSIFSHKSQHKTQL